MNEHDWTEQAACKTDHGGHAYEAFVDRGGDTRTNALIRKKFIARCRTSCPVRAQCLELALIHEQPPHGGVLSSENRHGIWGGYLPETRYRIELDRRNNAERTMPNLRPREETQREDSPNQDTTSGGLPRGRSGSDVQHEMPVLALRRAETIRRVIEETR